MADKGKKEQEQVVTLPQFTMDSRGKQTQLDRQLLDEAKKNAAS